MTSRTMWTTKRNFSTYVSEKMYYVIPTLTLHPYALHTSRYIYKTPEASIKICTSHFLKFS